MEETLSRSYMVTEGIREKKDSNSCMCIYIFDMCVFVVCTVYEICMHEDGTVRLIILCISLC